MPKIGACMGRSLGTRLLAGMKTKSVFYLLYLGKPCALYDENNPDWGPSKHLGGAPEKCTTVAEGFSLKINSLKINFHEINSNLSRSTHRFLGTTI